MHGPQSNNPPCWSHQQGLASLQQGVRALARGLGGLPHAKGLCVPQYPGRMTIEHMRSCACVGCDPGPALMTMRKRRAYAKSARVCVCASLWEGGRGCARLSSQPPHRTHALLCARDAAQIKLKNLVIACFIPPDYQDKIMQHCHWQDYEGTWSIDFLQYAGNAIRAHQVRARRRGVPISCAHAGTPEKSACAGRGVSLFV